MRAFALESLSGCAYRESYSHLMRYKPDGGMWDEFNIRFIVQEVRNACYYPLQAYDDNKNHEKNSQLIRAAIKLMTEDIIARDFSRKNSEPVNEVSAVP